MRRIAFSAATGVLAAICNRLHSSPQCICTFPFYCRCGAIIRVTAGQAGIDKYCVRCGKPFRVPSLSSLITESVDADNMVRSSAAQRYSLAALLFWVSVVTLLLGISKVQH